MAEWTTAYEWDLLQALAQAHRSRDPRALSHKRYTGDRWMVQDLGRYGFLRAGIPVASVHRAARVLMGKGLVAKRREHGGNYYSLTEAGKARTDHTSVRDGRCPDGGYCHGRSLAVGSEPCPDGSCLRVRTSGPLSGRFPGNVWPAEVVAANKIVGHTTTGRAVTAGELDALADEAEAGYPLDRLHVEICASCDRPALGYARGVGGERLCHTDQRRCYRDYVARGNKLAGQP